MTTYTDLIAEHAATGVTDLGDLPIHDRLVLAVEFLASQPPDEFFEVLIDPADAQSYCVGMMRSAVFREENDAALHLTGWISGIFYCWRDHMQTDLDIEINRRVWDRRDEIAEAEYRVDQEAT